MLFVYPPPRNRALGPSLWLPVAHRCIVNDGAGSQPRLSCHLAGVPVTSNNYNGVLWWQTSLITSWPDEFDWQQGKLESHVCKSVTQMKSHAINTLKSNFCYYTGMKWWRYGAMKMCWPVLYYRPANALARADWAARGSYEDKAVSVWTWQK